MTEFYSDDPGADDFALPGDEQLVATLTGQEPEAAPEPEAQPRSEDGKFAPKDTPEPEAAVEETSEPEASSEPELILGKFKSADELAAAYQELESFKGRQSSEISELRQALEERFESLQQQQAQPVTAQTPVTQDLIDANPAAATELAYQQGNRAALAAAFEAWEMEQPARAAAWIGQKQIEESNRQWAERYAQLEQKLAPVQQQATATELQAGVAGLTAKYPEIGEFLQGDAFAQLANEIPLAKKALVEGAPDEVVSAIEAVYLIHRGRASDNLKDKSREVARTAAEEAQSMREEAFVASTTATTTAPRKSRADEIAEGWNETDDMFGSGWNI